MKAKINFLIILFTFIKIGSQTILNETFTGNSLPDGWSISSTATDYYERWNFYDDYDDVELNESSTIAQNEWLYLPSLNLQSYSEMYFNFSLWLYNKKSWVINKSCRTAVMISTNNGSSWSELWSTDILNSNEFNGDALFERIWSVNLSSYCGTGNPDVKIAFKYTSNGTKVGDITNNVSFAALLRVNISGLPITSLSNLDKQVINWYPIPNYTGGYDIYYGSLGTTTGKSDGVLVSGLTGTSFTIPEDYCQYTAYVRSSNTTGTGEWIKLNFLNVVDDIIAIPDTNSSLISWTGDNELYDIEYGIGNFSVGNGTRVNNIASTSYNINSLLPNTAYKVYIKASCNTASWKSLTFTTNQLSVQDLNKKEIILYPNPVKNILNIRAKENILAFEIYSLDGEKILSGQHDNFSQIDMTKLPAGNYILKLKTKTNEESFKIIKTN